MKAFDNDKTLLTALEGGDNRAFENVYSLYYKPLCYFAEKLTGSVDTAQDMVADSFIKLLQKKPHFESVTGLKSFLYTTTRNSCLDYFRTQKRHRASHAEIGYMSMMSEHEIENNIIRAEVLHAVYTAIDMLPEKYRQVMRMALVEGKSNDEIGAETGMAYQTIRNQKSEGLKLLKLAFKNSSLKLVMLTGCMAMIDQYMHRL